MKESILIENLGPLGHVELSDIRPLSVFMGPSGSGKSTLMKAVALARYINKYAHIRSFLHNSNIRRSPFRMEFPSLVKETGLDEMLGPQTRIVYTTQGASGNTYEITYANRKLGALPHIESADLIFQKGAFISEHRGAVSQLRPGGRGDRGHGLGYYFNETLDLFEQAMSELKTVGLPYLGLNISRHKMVGGYKYMLHADGVPSSSPHAKAEFELRHASSGIKTTTPASVIAEYLCKAYPFGAAFERSVLSYLYKSNQMKSFNAAMEFDEMAKRIDLHLEEPELSLDPHSQVKLMKHLVNLVSGFARPDGSQQSSLMVATHSPYIVNFLNLLLAEQDNGGTTGWGETRDIVSLHTFTDHGVTNSVVEDLQGRPIVDTSFMDEMMEDIYNNYDSLRQPS